MVEPRQRFSAPALAQVENLCTRFAVKNRMAIDESSGLPSDVVDSLSEMLKNMGKKLALPNQPPVDMASVCDLLDMPEERIVEEPPIVEVVEDEVAEGEQEGEEVADGDFNDAFGNEIEVQDVDDIEPLAPLSLREARISASRLFEIVTINIDYIKRAGSSTTRDYSHDLDALVQALAFVRETTRTRQGNLMSWLVQRSSETTNE